MDIDFEMIIQRLIDGAKECESSQEAAEKVNDMVDDEVNGWDGDTVIGFLEEYEDKHKASWDAGVVAGNGRDVNTKGALAYCREVLRAASCQTLQQIVNGATKDHWG